MAARILVACERSQVVTLAFRLLGHAAFSCDIVACSGDKPEWHIQDDARSLDYSQYDLVIAHPPCTYMSRAGATAMYRNGNINAARAEQLYAARDFFMFFWQLPVPHVAIENPIPLRMAALPMPSQKIEPYMFGDAWTKRTWLWLKDLPPLVPTCPVVPCGSWTKHSGSPIVRARSFQGIANAMAAQWGSYIDNCLSIDFKQ